MIFNANKTHTILMRSTMMKQGQNSTPGVSGLSDPSFAPPWWFRNAHVQTIVGGLFPRPTVAYERERLTLEDGDFLDLDWSRVGSDNVAILSHGLEGHSRRTYMTGMVRILNEAGWDVLAWNYRGCGGTVNNNPCLYHNGSTDDLQAVIHHCAESYGQIALVGFSMGGNIGLLHLGREAVHAKVCCAVAIAPPCDLTTLSPQMAKPPNRLYMARFLKSLRKKIKQKKAQFPDIINDDGFSILRDFKGFDDRYTAPLHGFKNAEDYWEQCSSGPWLKTITVPTLIITAQDDPFLTPTCIPYDACAENANLTLIAPPYGGHCAFMDFRHPRYRWSERVTRDYLVHCTRV